MIKQSTTPLPPDEVPGQQLSADLPTSGNVFRQQWLAILVIMTGLVIWGGVHAWGAYYSRCDELGVLKALFVLLSMALFLSCWGGLLWLRQRKIRRPSMPNGHQEPTVVSDLPDTDSVVCQDE